MRKRVDGRGGQDIFVGDKLSREEFVKAREIVEKEPESFIVQKYVALSQVTPPASHLTPSSKDKPPYLVDIRGPSFICNYEAIELSGGHNVGVSPVMWGRGTQSEGTGGKVNISAQGFEFAIACEKEPNAEQVC